MSSKLSYDPKTSQFYNRNYSAQRVGAQNTYKQKNIILEIELPKMFQVPRYEHKLLPSHMIHLLKRNL